LPEIPAAQLRDNPFDILEKIRGLVIKNMPPLVSGDGAAGLFNPFGRRDAGESVGRQGYPSPGETPGTCRWEKSSSPPTIGPAPASGKSLKTAETLS